MPAKAGIPLLSVVTGKDRDFFIRAAHHQWKMIWQNHNTRGFSWAHPHSTPDACSAANPKLASSAPTAWPSTSACPRAHHRYPQRPPLHFGRHRFAHGPLFRQQRAILARPAKPIRHRGGRARGRQGNHEPGRSDKCGLK